MKFSLPYNDFGVEIYDASNNLLNDPDETLDNVTGINFGKQFNGGLFTTGSFFAHRDPLREWIINGAKRVIFRNGFDAAYEGWIRSYNYSYQQDENGVLVNLVGASDQFLMNLSMVRVFADNRVSEDAWQVDTAGTGWDKATYDRSNRLKIVPKNVSWASGDWTQYVYRVQTGSTVRRIKGDYQLQEGAQTWQIDIYRSTDGVTWTLEYTIANASGTGSFDRTLGTATLYIAFRFTNTNAGAQTPAEDGTILGEIYNVMVYESIMTLTSDITMETVARWMIAFYSQSWGFLNDSTYYIQSPGTPLVVEPFVWANMQPLGTLLNDIVSLGDGAQARWAWNLLCSEEAPAANGRPVLQLLPQPDLTDYEYQITLDSENLLRPYEVLKDNNDVFNWVPVRYTDQKGIARFVTPTDDSGLFNQASWDKYGRRVPPGGLDVGQLGLSVATAYGKTYLAANKDAHPRLVTPIEIVDYLLSKEDVPVPASLVNPGERIQLSDMRDDETDDPLAFIITSMTVNGDVGSAILNTGSPLMPYLPRLAQLKEVASLLPEIIEGVISGESSSSEGGGGGGGGDGGNLNWKRKFAGQLEKLGIDPWKGPKLGDKGFWEWKKKVVAQCKALKKSEGKVGKKKKKKD